jgi:site-specific recombinase XerD
MFIRWCESSEIVKDGLADKMQIPDVTENETVSEESVSRERMDGLLTYLEHCEYATRQRALFEVLWYAGCRISGALALDFEDFRLQENHTKFRDSGCPHDRDTDGCEAAQNKPKATGCPSSKSLHLIGRGSYCRL